MLEQTFNAHNLNLVCNIYSCDGSWMVALAMVDRSKTRLSLCFVLKVGLASWDVLNQIWWHRWLWIEVLSVSHVSSGM